MPGNDPNLIGRILKDRIQKLVITLTKLTVMVQDITNTKILDNVKIHLMILSLMMRN